MTPPTPSDYSDDRLLAFLRGKLAGNPLPASAATHFHDADIYAADPAILTSIHEPAPTKEGYGDSWFFFTHVKPKSSRDTRKSRQVAGGVGTWHSERAPRGVFDDGGNCIGYLQYFSYKIKTGKNSSERTQWYMVEFSDDDQEGNNHDRIHGGEPVLVLCKIYKAHSNSRSSTTRKRKKPTDELLNQASSPLKSKRRLFDSTAPISVEDASQEPVSSKTWYELAPRLKPLHSGIESKPSPQEAEPEASHRSYQLSSRLESLCSSWLVPKPLQDEEAKPEEPQMLQEKLSCRASYNLQLQGMSNATLDSTFRSELDSSRDKVSESIIQRFWTEAETKPLQDEEAKPEEPVMLQEKLRCRASYNLQLQGMSNATLDSTFRSELDSSRDKVSESIIQRFWTEATEEQEALQEKLVQDKSSATLDSAFKFVLEPLQDKVSDSIIQRFWTLETEASQVDTSMMNCSFFMAGGALPMHVHCAPEVALSSPSPMPAHSTPRAFSSASWIGNDITVSCSSELGCVVGPPTYNESGSIAGGGIIGKPDVRSMPFAPVPPAVVAPWLFSGLDIWSC